MCRGQTAEYTQHLLKKNKFDYLRLDYIVKYLPYLVQINMDEVATWKTTTTQYTEGNHYKYHYLTSVWELGLIKKKQCRNVFIIHALWKYIIRKLWKMCNSQTVVETEYKNVFYKQFCYHL